VPRKVCGNLETRGGSKIEAPKKTTRDGTYYHKENGIKSDGRTQEQQRLGEIRQDLDGLMSETLDAILICGD